MHWVRPPPTEFPLCPIAREETGRLRQFCFQAPRRPQGNAWRFSFAKARWHAGQGKGKFFVPEGKRQAQAPVLSKGALQALALSAGGSARLRQA